MNNILSNKDRIIDLTKKIDDFKKQLDQFNEIVDEHSLMKKNEYENNLIRKKNEDENALIRKRNEESLVKNQYMDDQLKFMNTSINHILDQLSIINQTLDQTPIYSRFYHFFRDISHLNLNPTLDESIKHRAIKYLTDEFDEKESQNQVDQLFLVKGLEDRILNKLRSQTLIQVSEGIHAL